MPPLSPRSTRRFARRLRSSLAAALAALALIGAGLAQDLGVGIHEGTELLFTSVDSDRIVGHGQVHDQRLVLNLSPRVDRFVLLLLHPDGDIELVTGFRGDDGSLRLEGDGGEAVALERLLSDNGIAVEFNAVRDDAFDDDLDRDDDRLDPTGPEADGG